LDRGKTGVITTVGEAIDSTVLGADTIIQATDIPVEEVPPTHMGTLQVTAPDRRTIALTPQLRIPVVELHITTPAIPQLYIPMAEPRTTTAPIQKLRMQVVVPRIAIVAMPRRRTIAAVNHTVVAVSTTSRQQQ
jgi:hypothetical protein